MPKESKQLSYEKCEQCRRDRQKCLPKDRVWPGRRCDRCLKYGYLCSASQTKTQESNRSSRRRSENSQDQSSSREVSPERGDQGRRSEVQCLQDLGDIRQLISCYLDLNQNVRERFETLLFKRFDKALQDVVRETEIWALQYETDGRYKDAAYLYSRIHSDCKEDSQILPTLATLYEKMGDYPAAELAQEKLIGIVLVGGLGGDPENITCEVKALSRLLSFFHTRLQVLGSASQIYAKMSIVYRAAVFDLEQLNAALLDQGLIVMDYLDEWMCSSLHVAVKKDAPNLARLLLQKEANPNLPDGSGATPLHIAVENKRDDIVQLLLDHGADTEIEDIRGNTAFQIASSKRRNESILLLLIQKGANIEARDALKRTPLGNAIVSDSPSTAKFLIRHGADVNATYNLNKNLGTLLFEAVRREKIWAVNLLLEKGADVQARNEFGETTLYEAVQDGQESMVKMLLDHDRRIVTAVLPRWSSMLYYAMSMGNLTIVEMIIKAGADIDAQNSLGDTPLHCSMYKYLPGHTFNIVSLLLASGAQVNIKNNVGETSLHFAIRHGRSEAVQMLLNAGAEPGLLSADGKTALDMASHYRSKFREDPRYEEIWKLLNSHINSEDVALGSRRPVEW